MHFENRSYHYCIPSIKYNFVPFQFTNLKSFSCCTYWGKFHFNTKISSINISHSSEKLWIEKEFCPDLTSEESPFSSHQKI